MTKLLAILAVFFGVVLEARAQSGFDILPLNIRGPHGMAITSANWNCDAWLFTFLGAREANFPMLWRTFGMNLECLETTLSLGMPTALQVYLTNGPGRKNRRLQAHEPLAGMSTRDFCAGLRDWHTEVIVPLQENAAEVFHAVAPHLRAGDILLIANDLESDCSSEEQGQYIRAVRPIFANIPSVPVFYVSYRELAPGADFYEADHGTYDCGDNPRCIKTNDGGRLNIKAVLRGKFAAAWPWFFASNCNVEGGPFIPPILRTNCFTWEHAFALRAYMLTAQTLIVPAMTKPSFFLHQVTPGG